MFMSILMFFTWQATGDSKYQEPFNKCADATYSKSTLKSYVDSAEDMAKDKAPAGAAVGPAAYALAVRKQFTFSSKKVSLAPGAVTSYHYDERAKSGTIAIVFAF